MKADLNHASGEFLERARVFWERRAQRPLTREDAREIMGILTGFFQMLSEWDQAERLAHGQPRSGELERRSGN
jgi:hypothetical protein